jgi:hypothetical protein
MRTAGLPCRAGTATPPRALRFDVRKAADLTGGKRRPLDPRRRGRPHSRDALAYRMREDGHAVSNALASLRLKVPWTDVERLPADRNGTLKAEEIGPARPGTVTLHLAVPAPERLALL